MIREADDHERKGGGGREKHTEFNVLMGQVNAPTQIDCDTFGRMREYSLCGKGK
jgi:hypothetical protein